MKKSIFWLLIFLLSSQSAFAANSVISFTDQVVSQSDYTKIQTEAANPSLTIKILDNNSHNLTLVNIQTSSTAPILFFSLRFNGAGTGCIVRLMNTTTKASWVAYPVAAGGVFGQGIHPNTLFINYSSCFN